METILAAVGIIISSFIAYHIFFLSKRLSAKDKFEHIKVVKEYVSSLKSEIYGKGRRSRVYVVDVDVYEKYYPSNENRFERYSHLAGELKDAALDGVEVINGIVAVRKEENGAYRIIEDSTMIGAVKAVRVGIVPYEWIVDINLHGDGVNISPLIYCHFRKKSRWYFKRRIKFTAQNEMYRTKIGRLTRVWSPFRAHRYYLLNTDYQEGKNHPREQYSYSVKVMEDSRQ